MAKKKKLDNEPLDLSNEKKIEFIKLHFVDLAAKSHFLSYKVDHLDYDQLQKAIVIPSVSIPGLEFYNRQLFLKPDLESVFVDPFAKQKTLVVNCSLVTKMQESTIDYAPTSFDIREITNKAENYLRKLSIGHNIEFHIVMEFFLFEGIECHNWDAHYWNQQDHLYQCSTQQRFVDDLLELRNIILITLEEVGINACMHFLEIGAKCVVSFSVAGATAAADKIQIAKYIIKSIAHRHNRTATFMPSPIMSQDSAGLSIGHSIYSDNKSIFQCPEHHHLSEVTMHYISGILANASSIFAFTNPTTNSYRRLNIEQSDYVEFRYISESPLLNKKVHRATPDDLYLFPGFPDSSANPYLSIAAIILAGIYGIENKVKLESPIVKYDRVLKVSNIQSKTVSLLQTLESLSKGRGLLKSSNVFDDVLIDNYIKVKKKEWKHVASSVSPVEFDLYY